MTIPRTRLLPSLAAVGLASMLLAGCAGGSEPAPTRSVEAGAATPAATAQPDPSPSATAEQPTCDTIIGDDLLTRLGDQGWTSKESPFSAGGVTLDRGLQCMWADFAVASGNLMIFGWAPITADQAAEMQRGLEAHGWLREQHGADVFITEDPMQAPTVDENGYGMTYQFGDGWVTVADVKQNLLLIQRPQG